MAFDETIVVEGEAIAAPTYQQTGVRGVEPGVKQETRCRDPIFALLFYANVAAILSVACSLGFSALQSDSSIFNYSAYYNAMLLSGAIGLVLSAIGLKVLMMFPEAMIKVALWFSVLVAFLWMVFAFLFGQVGAAIIGAIFFLISLCYAYAVQSRIPFATVNLVTSITAVQSNLGVTVVAYSFVGLAVGWTFLWGVAGIGALDGTQSCDDAGEDCSVSGFMIFLFLLSFFFTQQVISNCVHVTVAGVVGTWWFAPDEAESCCSPAVTSSFIRTMTTSFGSICFGSLLVAILQTLKAMAQQARQEEGGICVCLAECILSCLESLLEYFNKWAFVYVGLYGYSYLEAGKNVFTLFKNRGWEAIIADDLVSNTLFLGAIVVGGVTGVFGIFIEMATDWFGEDQADDAILISFLVAFLIGTMLAMVLFSTIESGVNTVIVLFAEAPAELQQHHPELSARMRETWSRIYPGSI